MIIGIDPGLRGALSFLDPSNSDLFVEDMPVVEGQKGKNQVDATQIVRIINDWRFCCEDERPHVVCELVGAMPGQGVTSMFNFGTSYGVIKGVIAAMGLPITFVRPAEWKRDLRVPASKEGARARATELFPESARTLWPLKSHDGRAEAALIAYFGKKLIL